MIDGIRPQLNYGDTAARKGGKVDTAQLSAAGVEQDKVELTSASASTLPSSSSSSAPIDKAKIAAIRSAISKNAYPIDFQKLADRMIEVDVLSGSQGGV
jgi:flagellar biosynthesis anti-sigma factor FlgM